MASLIIVQVIDDGPLENPVEGFIDEEFPPMMESVGPQEHVPPETEWFRAPALSYSGGPVKLCDVMEPSDILQGSLGDTWLLAGIAAVSEFAGYIQSNLIKEQEIQPDGRYTVRLYDIAIQDWLEIVIDDMIPCKVKSWYSIINFA